MIRRSWLSAPLRGALVCCAAALALLLIGGACGCGSGGARSAERSAQQTIKFSTWGTEKDIQLYRSLIRDFSARQPSIAVTPVLIPWANYFTKIQLLIVGRVAPDVLTVSADMAYELQHNNQLLNLQPFVERERQRDPGFMTETEYDLKAVLPLCTVNGNFYYLPVGPMTMHLYYNKTLFDAAGVPYPDETWSWQNLRDAAKRLTVRDADGRVTQWGFTVDNWWQWWISFLWQNNAALFDDMLQPRRCMLATPEAMETFTFLRDIIHVDHSAPTPIQLTQLNGNFMTGKVAMQIQGSWLVEQFRTLKAFQWDIAPLPHQRCAANVVTVCGMAIAAQCPEPEAAWQFARDFMRPEAQRLLCDDCTLWIPLQRQVIAENPMREIAGLPAHHALRFSQLHEARPGVIRHPAANRLVQVIAMGLDPLFAGKVSAQDCLPALAAKVDAILAEPADASAEELP